jgi:hypothetical protein
VTYVEALQHVPGTSNIADLAKRGHTTIEVGPRSKWQVGPAYL